MSKLKLSGVCILLTVFMLSLSTYEVNATSFDLLTPYGDSINSRNTLIEQIDFTSSYGLAVDANPFGPGGAGDPFQFVFQSSIDGIIDVNGFNSTVSGLNQPTDPKQVEFTIVGSIWETGSGLGSTIATFDLATPPVGQSNFFEIYVDQYDGSAGQGIQSNINVGSGFNDGKLIMRAEAVRGDGLFTILDVGANGIPDNQDRGIGSTKVDWSVTFYDDDFWNFPWTSSAKPWLVQSSFDGTLNLPPPDSANGLVMWDGTTPDFYKNIGDSPFTTEDILFKLDGFKIFTPVPEPSTMFLMGLGLLCLAKVTRKSKSQR